MNCPYCGEEMRLGYIQGRDNVIWDTKKRMVAALPSLRNSAIFLGDEGGPFAGTSVSAYNCEKCKKIIIEY